MLQGEVYYHGLIRKTIVAFGSLFSNIYIDRKQTDSVNGDTVQRLQVPLAYAPKEKWLVRLDSDPNLQNHTYTSLPRMSFEITNYSYDPTRKTNRMQKITYNDSANPNNNMWTYTPVPYNIDISLYVLSKNQEDGLQIIEQILPTFTPDYNLSINAVPEINMVQDVPVILNSTTVTDDYDGDFQTRRFVTHTLNFTLKANLFGNVNSNGKILEVNANIGLKDINNPNRIYTATGDAVSETVSSENWESNF